MFSSSCLLAKALRQTQITHTASRFHFKEPPVLVDITYQEMSKKFPNTKKNIFKWPERVIGPAADLVSGCMKKAFRPCVVFKEMVIRRRLLPRLPEKRKEIPGIVDFKSIKLISPMDVKKTSSSQCQRSSPDKNKQ